ncbi:hypothetical protein [Fournierella sp.]|uniref:hypothetical protein n=1 Tax=Allofournierella sp. TaxID=1940256 RepID=UPI003079C93C
MKHRKNTAFFIEALLLTLFVLALCTVLVRLFAAARLRSAQAQELTAAQQIAQNVSESFYASDSEEQFWQLLGASNPPAEGQALTLTVDSQGRPDPIGTYELELTLEHQPAQAGQTARLTLQLSDSGGQSLFTGSFDRYLPGT